MHIRRAMPVVVTEDPAGTRDFHEGLLGFRVAMDEPGFLMLVSPSVPTTQVIVCWESPAAMDPQVARVDISVEVADIDAAHDAALARGVALTDEPWGVRRFFVREPSGAVVNVASHIADPG